MYESRCAQSWSSAISARGWARRHAAPAPATGAGPPIRFSPISLPRSFQLDACRTQNPPCGASPATDHYPTRARVSAHARHAVAAHQPLRKRFCPYQGDRRAAAAHAVVGHLATLPRHLPRRNAMASRWCALRVFTAFVHASRAAVSSAMSMCAGALLARSLALHVKRHVKPAPAQIGLEARPPGSYPPPARSGFQPRRRRGAARRSWSECRQARFSPWCRAVDPASISPSEVAVKRALGAAELNADGRQRVRRDVVHLARDAHALLSRAAPLFLARALGLSRALLHLVHMGTRAARSHVATPARRPPSAQCSETREEHHLLAACMGASPNSSDNTASTPHTTPGTVPAPPPPCASATSGPTTVVEKPKLQLQRPKNMTKRALNFGAKKAGSDGAACGTVMARPTNTCRSGTTFPPCPGIGAARSQE